MITGILFATVLSVTTYSHSGDYVLDTASSYTDCISNTQTHENALLNIWGDNEATQKWLNKFNIELNPSHIEKASVECVEIEEELIP